MSFWSLLAFCNVPKAWLMVCVCVCPTAGWLWYDGEGAWLWDEGSAVREAEEWRGAGPGGAREAAEPGGTWTPSASPFLQCSGPVRAQFYWTPKKGDVERDLCLFHKGRQITQDERRGGRVVQEKSGSLLCRWPEWRLHFGQRGQEDACL